MPSDFIGRVLKDFNERSLDAATAAEALGISRAQLYRYRTAYLRDQQHYEPRGSGGNRRNPWPAEALQFMDEFLPLQKPPNYQLISDELERLFGFKRARSCVEAYAKSHFADQLSIYRKKKPVYRRFRRSFIGELYQHDSSIHQWWPSESKQTLLMTTDDHSGLITGGRFVVSDTTWNHFQHFRYIFEAWGMPEIIYTDGLSLFGPSSCDDVTDPKSEFQRALKGLCVAHLVAPTPQAKGKIERRFGTFQNRLVALMAHAKVRDWHTADQILQMEITRRNKTRLRTTGKIPLEVWEEQMLHQTGRIRPIANARLLDLHLSLRQKRRVNNDHTIDFQGSPYEISATKRKTVSIVHHPKSQFWVVEHLPKDVWPPVLGHFTL
jgi:hypothetical protein